MSEVSGPEAKIDKASGGSPGMACIAKSGDMDSLNGGKTCSCDVNGNFIATISVTAREQLIGLFCRGELIYTTWSS